MLNELSEAYIIYTLYLDAKVPFNNPATKNEHIRHFDTIILQMSKICDKYGSRMPEEDQENLWLFAMKGIYLISEGLRGALASKGNEEDLEEMDKFEVFMLIRKQYFMTQMNDHVNLRKTLVFLKEIGHDLKYNEFKHAFEEKLDSQKHTEKILHDAKRLVDKDLSNDHQILIKTVQQGAGKNKSTCDGCNLDLIGKYDKQDIWLFQCNHTFHARCMEKSEGLCSVCFNEVDAIHSLSSLKSQT